MNAEFETAQDAAAGDQQLASEPAALRDEVAQLKDANLRLMAEMRNVQQRAAREKAEALRYAEGDLARDLLVVLDDLDRAREAAVSEGAPAAVTDGIRIVQENFLKLLAARGIEPIDATGRPFDPGLHEALMQQPSAAVPGGHVLQEVARGFRMHQRVLRPSRVIVSSGAAQQAD